MIVSTTPPEEREQGFVLWVGGGFAQTMSRAGARGTPARRTRVLAQARTAMPRRPPRPAASHRERPRPSLWRAPRRVARVCLRHRRARSRRWRGPRGRPRVARRSFLGLAWWCPYSRTRCFTWASPRCWPCRSSWTGGSALSSRVCSLRPTGCLLRAATRWRRGGPGGSGRRLPFCFLGRGSKRKFPPHCCHPACRTASLAVIGRPVPRGRPEAATARCPIRLSPGLAPPFPPRRGALARPCPPHRFSPNTACPRTMVDRARRQRSRTASPTPLLFLLSVRTHRLGLSCRSPLPGVCDVGPRAARANHSADRKSTQAGAAPREVDVPVPCLAPFGFDLRY